MKSSSKQNTNNESGVQSETENDLRELFLDQIADMYDAEKQLTKALPQMAKTARNEELREGFESHLEETKEHVTRLEELAKNLDVSIKHSTCQAMKGLVAEAKELMDEHEDTSALDDALIMAAQKVEHYEIATYGTLCAWAERLGFEEPVELLEQTLEEEKAADDKLTGVAEFIGSHNTEAQ